MEDAGWVDGGSGGCSGFGEGFGGGLLLLLLGTRALVVEEGGDSGTGGSTGCCDGSESGLGHVVVPEREEGRKQITQRGNGEAKVGGHGTATDM